MLRHSFQHSQLKPLWVFEGYKNELTKFQSNFVLFYELLCVDNYRYVFLRLLSFLGMVALTIFSKTIFHLLVKSKDSHANHISVTWGQVLHAASSKSSSSICPICKLARTPLSSLEPY